jgi:branched-chain amino acid aminotransferase
MQKVYINGEFFEEGEAKVSVFDHGYLYGDGVFETLRAYGGRIFRLEDHLIRLWTSAEGISLTFPWQKETLTKVLRECLSVNDCRDAILRLSISRGAGPPGLDPALCEHPTLVVITRPFSGYSSDAYERGVPITIVPIRKNLSEAIDARIKSTNFLNNILAKIASRRVGAEEGILLNQEGYLTEGTVSNLFFVSGGILYTPSLAGGILEGITRRVVLEIAREEKITIETGLFLPERLYKADEVFLTNTSYEVMPVRRVDHREFTVGAVTRRLMEAFHERTSRKE